MRVHMRGCRGSTPVPGTETVRYGGNTTCIEVTTRAGDVLIFDAGTGIRQTGLDLMASAPVKCAVFISHTHWDHIQGLPFFVPLFAAESQVDFFGGFDPVYGKSLQDILSQQMQYCYFPVRENELQANIRYTTLREQETIKYGSARITNLMLNHPVLNYGYRVEADGGVFVFTGDYEPPGNIYAPEDDDYEDYQDVVDLQLERVAEFVRGADVLIIDAQYTDEEYRDKVGWGHGTYSSGIELGRAAGVGRVLLTHHEPTRSDDQLDAIAAWIQAGPASRPGPTVELAREGLEFEVTPRESA